MWKTYIQSWKIDITVTLNALLYFVKRIPLVKRLFKRAGYGQYELKGAFSIIGIIISFIISFVKINLMIFIGTGIALIYAGTNVEGVVLRDSFMHMFVVYYFILGLFFNVYITEMNRKKFICVKLLKMDARNYILSQYITKRLWNFICELPAMLLISVLTGTNMAIVLVMLIAKNLASAAGEVLQMQLVIKKEYILAKHVGTYLLCTMALVAFGAVPVFLGCPIVISNMILIIISVVTSIAGAISLRCLFRYRHYYELVNRINRLESLAVDMEKVKSEANFADVRLKEKTYTSEELQSDKYADKKGFDYLNALFFSRHRRLIYKPMIIQSIIIIVLFTAASTIALLNKETFTEKYEEAVTKFYPIFIFVQYILNTTNKAAKAMFYNCDSSLLCYGFYRNSSAMLKTFSIRIKKMMAVNLVPAVLICTGIIVLQAIGGKSIVNIIPVAVLIIASSIFFVTHNMFLYYILQPYTVEKGVKNPLYSIIQSLLYIVCYAFMNVNGAPFQLLIGIIIATVIYTVIALIVVYKCAPRTFVRK